MTANPSTAPAAMPVVSHEPANGDAQAALRSTDATQDPVVMPSEEEIARAIYHGKPRNKPWDVLTHEFKNQYRKQARHVLALFAPILEEKERVERGEEPGRLSLREAHEALALWRTRALAAEAALAAERQEGAKPDVGIRRNDDSSIDEVVAKGVSVHLEQMDAGSWFLGLDAGEKTWQFWLTASNRRTKVSIYHEHDDGQLRAAAIRAQGE